MAWYDLFSYGYDGLEPLYRRSRKELVAALRPGGGRRVVDLACGTGQNFPHLLERMGPHGRLVGVDASAGMLRRARRRVERGGWDQVALVHADARSVPSQALADGFGSELGPDTVVCTLGLSALPDWEQILEGFFARLVPGGQFLILDVHAERRVPQTWWVERIARADLARRVWEPLERLAADFELRWLPGSPHVHGGRLFLATGSKR